jgi:nitronate monooxygenase
MKPPFFNDLSIPVIAAPMFLISGPELVISCCKNGIVGTFPALNNRSTEGFEQWVIQIKNELKDFENKTGKKAAPYGVNLIVHPTNMRVQADLAICIKHKVQIIITSLGAVPELVDSVQSYGGLVYHDVIKRRHAEKASEAGVDGLILVAAGAGGHAGTLHPIPLINQIRSFFDKTILLSGCLSSGKDIASAMQMGADFAFMGTRFINVNESNASEDYKQMIINSSAEDIVYTAAVSGVHGSFLRPSLEAMGITEEQWSKSKKVDFGSELDAAKAEAQAWKTIWSAGQGVSSVNDVQTCESLINQLKSEFKQAIKDQTEFLDIFS